MILGRSYTKSSFGDVSFKDMMNKEKYVKQLLLAITSMVVLLLTLGCSSTLTKLSLYENFEFGISLQRSEIWDIYYSKRNGDIMIFAKLINNNSMSHINISGPACVPGPEWEYDPLQDLEDEIINIRNYYDLNEITIISDPTVTDINGKKTYREIIEIPTMALPEDSPMNRMGEQDPQIYQTIELYSINKQNAYVTVRIYLGINEEINHQAKEIINSIEFICLPDD